MITSVERSNPISECQDKLLTLLKKFDQRCSEFGITYYLGGGTALGAVRHEGFLPWDDDVDLYITRREYLKLCAVQDQFFTEDFVLANNENFVRYRNPYARCIDVNSTAITKTRMVDDAPKGQFLEIFILDPVPKTKQEQDKWLTLFWIYCELLSITYRSATEKNAKWVDFELYDKYLAQCEEQGRDFVLQKLAKQLFCIDENEADDYILSWGQQFYLYPIKAFGEPRRVTFEDTSLPVAQYAELVFRRAYGDNWAIIPNLDGQIQHNVKLDMERSYLEYMAGENEYERLWKHYPERKTLSLRVFAEEMNIARMQQNFIRHAVKGCLENQDALKRLQEFSENQQYAQMRELLSPWIDAQFSQLFSLWNQYLDIGDEYLEYILLMFLHLNEMSHYLKILKWRRLDSTNWSDNIQQYDSYGQAIRRTNAFLDIHDLKNAEQALLKAESFPWSEGQYDCQFVRLRYEVENARIVQDKVSVSDFSRSAHQSLQDVKAYAIALLKYYPSRKEILYYIGTIEFLMQDYSSAVEHLKQIYEITRNGMMRKEIRNMLEQMETDNEM